MSIKDGLMLPLTSVYIKLGQKGKEVHVHDIVIYYRVRYEKDLQHATTDEARNKRKQTPNAI